LNEHRNKGIPAALSPEELSASAIEARDFIADESSRVIPAPDPATTQHYVVSNSDLATLRAKFPFLRDFSDEFITANKPESLIKLEANVKLKEAERAKDADDRLAHNRAIIGTICVDMGIDDRTTHLHDGRFLPGANCSAAKLWLAARERTPLNGAPPLGNYDMAAVGLGGFVSPRGWVELANPAASFIMPWNFSFTALENFLINSRFCRDDLGEIENKAQLLTQFTDYVLSENAAKWRDNEPFLSTGELKNTWSAFFSARPQSAFIKRGSSKGPPQAEKKPTSKGPKRLPFIDVCYNWNKGICNKPAGSCFSIRGNPLRHVCDFRNDPSNLSAHCGQNHKRTVAHP
jgi:hypothetical protein